jgi:hypothetical protein
MAQKFSDLYAGNPVFTPQDEDLIAFAVWDTVSAYDSGAGTFANFKASLPTLYTSDGSLLADRTVDMQDFTLLFQAGLFGVGQGTLAEVLAQFHVSSNDERSALGVGDFIGVEPLLHAVFAMPDSSVLAMIPEGGDVANASDYRMLMALGAGGGDFNMSMYNGIDLRVQFNTATGGNLLEMYDSLGSLVIVIDESGGNVGFGAFGQPIAFEVYGNIGFNTGAIPQPDLSQGASPSFGAVWTGAEQTLANAMLQALLDVGIFRST